MKRPPAFYFAAVWSLLMLFMGLSVLSPKQSPTPPGGFSSGSMVGLVVFAIVIWQAVGLFRMRRLNHWLAVGVLALMTAGMLIFVSLRLIQGGGLRILGIVAIPTAAALNIWGIWYLTRRPLLDFATRFAAEHDKERHSRMAQKISQKKVSDETRS